MPQLATCPQCNMQLRVPDHLVSQDVKCPSCGRIFTANIVAGRGSPAEYEPAAPPRRQRDDAGYSERPQSPRRDDQNSGLPPPPPREYDDFNYDVEERTRGHERRRRAAAGTVAAPAIALMVVGILGIIMGVMNIASAASSGFGDAPIKRNDPSFEVGRYIGATISLIWGVAVTLGASNMKSLQSRGTAITGAVVAMVPCNLCCLFGLPIGIWALVALYNSDVTEAFD